MLGLVTAEVASALDPDLLPLDAAMRRRLGDDRVRIVSWDDASVDWSCFDVVIVRSTWDYTDRLAEFLDWVDRVDAVTTVINDADVIRWNTDKRYLSDLEAAGFAIAPTVFVDPGDAPPAVTGVHVVKPTVGAGSSGARRCEPDEVSAHVALLHSEGRTAMVQPYLDRLDELGETALCFVASPQTGHLVLSHAFRKGAILTSTTVEQEGDLFAKEQIDRRTSNDEEVGLARRVLASDVVRRRGRIMFARVDIAPYRTSDGIDGHVVMELELIEPSFYFSTDPATVDTFADALDAWLGTIARRHTSGVD
ncbi:MAG: hypothetical protein ABJH68_15610 [Ilumatobacter sp.]|uniref:ATP-grasp domain-containing protein n=1 Tax=Ilumatobacter sp. TaxID=1967498 RepID=UPI003299B19F